MVKKLSDVIDLARYPIDTSANTDTDNEAYDKLIADCRRALDEKALCYLPGFVKPSAIDALKQEIDIRSQKTIWVEGERQVWSRQLPDSLPKDHVLYQRGPHRVGSITRDYFPCDGWLVSLFEQDPLTEFVRRCLGHKELYRTVCPYISINVRIMDAGSQHAWHFDTNDGVVSLMVQAALDGGHYEYAPYILDAESKDYEATRHLLNGDKGNVVRVMMEPGTFCLFKGSHSIHRVTKVADNSPDRVNVLFSYHQQPGFAFTGDDLRAVLGRLPESFH